MKLGPQTKLNKNGIEQECLAMKELIPVVTVLEKVDNHNYHELRSADEIITNISTLLVTVKK